MAGLRRLIGKQRAHVAVIGATAFAVGLLEAAFLVVASRTALAVASGPSRVELTRGVVVGVAAALGVAAPIVVARFMANVAGVRASMGLP